MFLNNIPITTYFNFANRTRKSKNKVLNASANELIRAEGKKEEEKDKEKEEE